MVITMNASELGARHRHVRKTILAQSREQYAASMGVAASTVRSWESGRSAVLPGVLARLTSDHGISSHWMLTGEGSPTTEEGPLRRSVRLPLLRTGVSAGAPTESDDVIEREIDLAEMLLQHPLDSYLMHVNGHSMIGAGISHGDTIIIDRAAEVKSGQIVVARVYGELTVKRYLIQGTRHILHAENPDPTYRDIEITDDMDLHIIGVVNHCIKRV